MQAGNLGARGYRHRRWLMLAWLAVSFFGFYMVEQLITVPTYYMYTPLDDFIPFLPVFVIPYAYWYIHVFAVALFLFIRDESQFLKNGAFICLGMAVCLAAYALLPNGQALRPETLGDGLCNGMIALLYSIDSPVNSAPSLHVLYAFASNSAVLYYVRGSRARFWVVPLSWVVTVLICLSTVFIKQHSVVDLVLGAAVAGVLHLLLYTTPLRRRPKPAEKEAKAAKTRAASALGTN